MYIHSTEVYKHKYLLGTGSKYSTSGTTLGRLMSTFLHTKLILMFVSAAFSSSTWKTHESAVNSFKKFDVGGNLTWPLSADTLANYCTWAFTEGKLKASTVASYLSSLKCIHNLRGLDSNAFDNFVLKAILKGKENLEFYEPSVKQSRKVMTLPLLKLMGHEIATANWNENSKLVVWGAATLGFFGSFRMGEILPSETNTLDNLTWNDIKFYGEKNILIHVKTPKSRNHGGEFVDVFEFPGHNVCPVKSLIRLRESSQIKDMSSPVFKFENGKLLTTNRFNKVLNDLLLPHLGSYAGSISCHSFRAGIPSALARFPEIADNWDIKGWARWEGNDYRKYTRLGFPQREKTHKKIRFVLNNCDK